MELTGRTPGYRGAAIRCPGCAETMSQEALEECEVDVCTTCHGIWIDWFDGEVWQVTTETLRATQGVLRGPADRASRNEPAALGACPRCTRQLVADRYALEGQATGVDLLRCEDCLGVFVSKTSTEMLAAFPSSEPPPPANAQESGAVTDWRRFIVVLKRLLGIA